MSSLLQERGFDPEDIRVVLNDRATADAIRDRLNWLLEGAETGMERVLFYSGHGAQLPVYNAVGEIDHTDECLVPYDFAWTKDLAALFTRPDSATGVLQTSRFGRWASTGWRCACCPMSERT